MEIVLTIPSELVAFHGNLTALSKDTDSSQISYSDIPLQFSFTLHDHVSRLSVILGSAVLKDPECFGTDQETTLRAFLGDAPRDLNRRIGTLDLVDEMSLTQHVHAHDIILLVVSMIKV